jgi:Na+-translocating ferredoxin:NAD+ oxidoreductase subunit B
MERDIYRELQQKMDTIGVGFTASESGLDIKVLKRLFTEEEARLYIACTQKMERIEIIAARANRKPEEIAPVMAGMADKGLLFSAPAKYTGLKPTHLAAAPWAGGMLEFQSFKMNKQLIQLLSQYLKESFRKKGNFLRIIPVNQEVMATGSSVLPFDDVKEIIDRANRILVVPCACVNISECVEEKVDQERDVCMTLDIFADFHADKALGRWVSKEEALQILRRCEDEGLIHQPSDTSPVQCICNCGKYCKPLIALKRHPHPAEYSNSSHYSQVDPALCTGCELCIPRCLMEAVTMGGDGIATINPVRCIGCGLCVSVCPTEALRLYLKPEGLRHSIPESNPLWRTTEEYKRDMEQTND